MNYRSRDGKQGYWIIKRLAAVAPRAVGIILILLCIATLSCFINSTCSGSGTKLSKKVETTAENRARHDLFSVSFPTDKDGWACGRSGTILHSADGGETWTNQKSGTDVTLTSIAFIDTQHGWAVGGGGTILHTKDGGKVWESQKSPVSLFLMGVHFADSHEGWAVGEKTNILHTDDGGKTWTIQFRDTDFILKRVTFCDAKNGWAVGEYGFIYHTADGGTTWIKQAGKFGISAQTGELFGENFLFDVVAVNSKTAWAVGIDGHIVKTTDGGLSWRKITDGIPRTHLFGVSQNGGSLVVGGKALLLTSPDAGSTFHIAKADPQISYGYIYGIAPRGKGAGFVAVGKAGWIYLTDQKALEWRLAKKR